MIALTMWRTSNGTFSELLVAARVEWGTLRQYSVIAGMYVFADVLRIDAVRRAEPSTCWVLFNLRVIVLGCGAKEYRHAKQVAEESRHSDHHHGDPATTGSHGVTSEDRLIAYAEILVICILGVSAAVYNEKLL